VASLFKPTLVTYTLKNGSYRTPDGKRVTKSTPGAVRTVSESKKWYGRYIDSNGQTIRVPLSESKASSKEELDVLAGEARKERVGITDKYIKHAARQLSEHLDEFETVYKARGVSPKQIAQVMGRIRRPLTGCEFRSIAELDADKVDIFMAKLRVEGKSIQTVNFYISAVKQFSKWLVKSDRLKKDPFASLQGQNVALDRRHDRRNFEMDEVRRVMEAAESSTKSFRGLTGADRVMLYATAIGTGLRVSELASLAPSSFSLTADPPNVRVKAAYTKNRKEVFQPLQLDLAAALTSYLAGKEEDQPVWPGTWIEKASKMIAKDLARARAAWLEEVEDNPTERRKREKSDYLKYRDKEDRVGDFHALRHSYITELERSGVSVKLAQELARHSDIRLTMNRYTHATLQDRGVALQNFPLLSGLASSGQNGRKMRKARTRRKRQVVQT
jgi:integrase/recombinase XerD